MSQEIKHYGGVTYYMCVRPSGLIVWDGGAKGGIIEQYPSGMFYDPNYGWALRQDWNKIAQAAQAKQHEKLVLARKFIREWNAQK